MSHGHAAARSAVVIRPTGNAVGRSAQQGGLAVPDPFRKCRKVLTGELMRVVSFWYFVTSLVVPFAMSAHAETTIYSEMDSTSENGMSINVGDRMTVPAFEWVVVENRLTSVKNREHTFFWGDTCAVEERGAMEVIAIPQEDQLRVLYTAAATLRGEAPGWALCPTGTELLVSTKKWILWRQRSSACLQAG
jgi:hypothetical protein